MNFVLESTYKNLPAHFYKGQRADTVPAPKIVLFNQRLAEDLGIDFGESSSEQLARYFSGLELLPGSNPIAQAYAGHQFGHYTELGDGRALLLGEHVSPEGNRSDIQLKGSGPTPYARRGDGKAALGPMLREYLISEAMNALGIPTTRSLAVVSTGEFVSRELPLPGAILTRVAASHIRVGTFELFAGRNDLESVKILADYTMRRHYPDCEDYRDFLRQAVERQVELIVKWMSVGFIHGIMNTDNMALSGETIDYGPCAFMNEYHPMTVFSSIDRRGRYAYANQPIIAQWNLARFAEAILPLLGADGLSYAEEVIERFLSHFRIRWMDEMRRKLGLFHREDDDEKLVERLLDLMMREQLDFTNTFRSFEHIFESNYDFGPLQEWIPEYQLRLSRQSNDRDEVIASIRATNPSMIPRNHLVEQSLAAASEQGDLAPLTQLLSELTTPFADRELVKPPRNEGYQTFCGT